MLERHHSDEPVPQSSDRSFGLVFCAVFSLIALWPALHGEALRLPALGVSTAFGLLALVKPGYLTPLNRWWLAFGNLLHKIVSPLIIGVIFFGLFAPVGLLMRLFGKRPLALRFDPAAGSYWIVRGDESRNDMRNQF